MNKNVLFIHHVSCLAGAERYLLSLIESLDKTHKVFFICQEPGPLSERLIELGVVVEYMPLGAWRKLSYLFANFRTIHKIVSFCKKNHIDLICSNNYRVSSYAVWPTKILGISCVTIIQDFVSRHKLWKFNTFQSDFLITVSKSVGRDISRYFHKKIFNVYNGIDIDKVFQNLKSSDVLREEFPQLRGKIIIGMVAHIIPLKGHVLFLKAMQRINKIFDQTMFVIVGDSPNVQQLSLQDLKMESQRLGLEDRVIFTGARMDALNLMKSFDILVHPSYKEAFGRVVMEAMALSIPVIATQCGGPTEIIEDGCSGFLVPVGSEDKIVNAVEVLLKDQDKRKSMGLAGKIRIKENFSVMKTVVQINSVFKEILNP